MKKFQILHIDEQLQELFKEFLMGGGAEFMELSKKSDKPVVFHKKTNQMSYLVSGECFIYLDDEEIAIKSGDLALIPMGVKHAFVSITDEIELAHIHWPLEFLETDRYIARESVVEGV